LGSAIRLLGALFGSAGLLIVGNGLYQTLVAVYIAGVGAPPEIVAPVLSAYYVGFVLGSLRGPVVVNRVGHVRAFAAFTAIAGAATMAHPILSVGIGWIACRFAVGFALAGVFVVIESWLSDRAPPAKRGSVMAFYMIISFTALALGQTLLTLATPTTFVLFNVAAGLFVLSLVPVAAIRVVAPEIAARPRLGLPALYRVSPVGVVGVAVVGTMNGAFYGLAPIFATRSGFDATGVSLFMGAAIIGGLLTQWPVGRLSDRFDRRRVLVGVAALAAVVAALFVASAQPVVAEAMPRTPWLYLLAAIHGGCVFTLYPVLVAHAHDHAGADQRVATSAGLLLAFGIGAAIGPAAATVPMAEIGPEALFAFTGSFALVIVGFALHRMRRRAAVPTEDKPAFVPLPPTLKGLSGMPEARAADPPAADAGPQRRPEPL
jgi:MFS family permease